jgi:Asp-tRNA(Asn)/Glu-tRNA(Gln) amidotransferase A subunit family amidase
MLAIDLDTCLERIRRMDGELQSFVCVQPLASTGSGPLNGVTFGAKDIFDTRDMPTEWGTPLMTGRQSAGDAAIVGQLRSLGAVLVGKTHTTAFAYFDPAPTRNPRNSAHTPGGSSSGSAAAVAAGMVAFALGSQTQGSVLRPASFCGVVGFKPGHGLLPVDGVMPFAPTLDTVGFFTTAAQDMLELWEAMGYTTRAQVADRVGALPVPPEVDPVMREAFLRAARSLGAPAVEAPPEFLTLHTVVKTINDYEGARTHGQHLERLRSSKLGDLIERGLATPDAVYQEAIARLKQARVEMQRLYDEYPVLLWPAALGPAPAGLGSTGDPRMNAPFTGLGVPAISIPMTVGGLPLGLQVTAGKGQEAMLLRTAKQLHEALRAAESTASGS